VVKNGPIYAQIIMVVVDFGGGAAANMLVGAGN